MEQKKMFKLAELDDVILRNVFKNCNLNERTSFRPVNKRFKSLIDQLPIGDLVIFDRMPVVTSSYKFANNEKWKQEDTAYVTNLNQFFERFGHKLETVNRLVIRSVNKLEYDFKIDLKRLTHLELYNITFTTSKILQSPVLQNLYQHEAFYNQISKMNVKKLTNTSTSFSGFSSLISQSVRNFDFLIIEECVFMLAVEFLPKVQINQLRICTSLDVAEQICREFQCVKVLELILIGMGPYDVQNDLMKLDTFLARKRDDLDVYIWGVNVTIDSLKTFLEFYMPIAGQTTFNFRRVNLIIDQCPIVNHLHEHDSKIKKFYDIIEIITFEKHIHAVAEFDQFKNLRDMYLNLTCDISGDFDQFLKYFPLLLRLEITQKPGTRLSNNLFDQIPVCKNVYHLKLYCFEPTNFDFLFKLPALKYLTLLLYYPIENAVFIKLLKELKYLAFFQVQFQRSAEGHSKEELSAFKKTVNSFVENELNLNDFKFTILIQRTKLKKINEICVVLRYTYERSGFIEKRFTNLSDDDHESVIKAIDHKGVFKPNQVLMNDDCVLKILRYLNFNDKTSCRVVSHQFKRLVDSFPITKLVVYDRSPILCGKFAFTDEEYTLQDCVYVSDLHTFFNNKFILRRLDSSTETLVINGLDKREFKIGSTFNKLTHLELRKVYITNPIVLKSPKIEKLYVLDAQLNSTDENYFYSVLGLNNLGCKLKHFSHSAVISDELKFYQLCSKEGIFNELRTLQCYVNDLKTLSYISGNFKKLKTLNVRIAKHRDDFIDLLDNNVLGKLVKKLRSDLNVNIFGMPLNKSTHKMIADFITHISSEFRFCLGRIGLTNNDLETFGGEFNEHPELFDGFFKQIDTIIFEDRLQDKSIIKKFTNVSEVSYRFWLEVRHDLPYRFKMHPQITSLILTSLPDGHYLNDIVDMVPVYCKNLTSLVMEQWDDVSFGFLLKLPKLKTLRLYLKHSFNQSLFIEMLRNLRHLSFWETIYERTDVHTKEELSSFKRLVQACIYDELRYRDCVFKIEIHHRKSYMGNEKYSFVRYVLKRQYRDSEDNSLTVHENDIRRVQYSVGYKRSHPESSIEHDTTDNIYRKKK